MWGNGSQYQKYYVGGLRQYLLECLKKEKNVKKLRMISMERERGKVKEVEQSGSRELIQRSVIIYLNLNNER